MLNQATDNNKRIAKNTLLLYIRMLFLLGIGLYTSRVILASLGAEDYGIYNVVGGFIAMFSIFMAGLSSATQRFITFDLGKGELKKMSDTFSSCVHIYIMIGLLVFIVAEIVGVWFLENKLTIPSNRLIAARWVFQFSLITLIIGMVSTPYNALIISHERMGAFAWISIYEALAKLVVAYQIQETSHDKLIIYALMLCLVQLSVRVIYSIYCRKNFKESKFIFMFNWSKIKEIYSFTGWAMLGGLASIGFTQGLNVLLNMFFNPVVNAARGVAVQVQNIINGFVLNFQTAINPQIIKSYAKGKTDEMFKLIFASSKFSFLLLFAISLPVMIEAEILLNLWLKEVPKYTPLFFRLIIITSMIDGISNPFMRAVDATGNIKKYQIIVGGLLLMIVPISYVVLKLGGAPYSVFIVHIVISFLAFVIRLYLVKQLIDYSISLYWKNVLSRLVMVICLCTTISLLLKYEMDASMLRLFVISVFSIIMVVLSSYYIALLPHEKKFVREKILSVICKKIK